MTVRYDLNEGYASCGSMQVDRYGDYVKWEDYEALLKQLTEATCELNMALRENAGLREELERNDEQISRMGIVWQD